MTRDNRLPIAELLPRRYSLKARLVFPVDSPPIEDGVVAVDGERIVAVGRSAPDGAVFDLGDAAILPGLVNAHTHLEFSDLAAPLGDEGLSFPDWIRAVVAHRRGTNPASLAVAVRRGLAEASRSGTTALCEIATPGWSAAPFADAPIDATVCQESIGLAADSIESCVDAAERHLAMLGADSRIRPGLSPHAPYTVHPDLLSKLVERSRQARIPLAMHLAESREELELLATGGGRLRDLLVELSAWHPESIPRGARPLDYLRKLATAHRALVIHANYLDDEEIAFLARHRERMTVVYCPRTHARFGHNAYPLTRMIESGVAVAIGTDSRASNPDLDLLAELQFTAARHPLPLDRILRLGTRSAADALGLGETIGSLAPGKRADLSIVDLSGASGDDPHELVFSHAATVSGTIFHGKGRRMKDNG